MQENFPQQNDQEKLREENEFLKMKIMLEHGADFGESGEELPAEVENQFLANVLAFEKQYEERKMIRIYDKIERPRQFRPAASITDNEINSAWEELREYINKYGVDLDACSPHVSNRELYRFTTEELFELETDDIRLPGWVTHFIYDEFYPDPIYDNTQMAVGQCIEYIFRKEPLEWMHHYRKENLRLNDYFPLEREEFQTIINRFKACYEEIELTDNKDITCTIEENNCIVKGKFSADGMLPVEKISFGGYWKVVMEKDTEMDYWYINEIMIEGIEF